MRHAPACIDPGGLPSAVSTSIGSKEKGQTRVGARQIFVRDGAVTREAEAKAIEAKQAVAERANRRREGRNEEDAARPLLRSVARPTCTAHFLFSPRWRYGPSPPPWPRPSAQPMGRRIDPGSWGTPSTSTTGVAH